MSGPLHQVVTNDEEALLKNRHVVKANSFEPGEMKYVVDYKRVKMKGTKRNACVVDIKFTPTHYEIEAIWYRAQHENAIKEIIRSDIKIPRQNASET